MVVAQVQLSYLWSAGLSYDLWYSMSFRRFLVSCYNYQLLLCHISMNSFDKNENHLILVQYFVGNMKVFEFVLIYKKSERQARNFSFYLKIGLR